jgi:hypothetical protein
MMKHEKFLNNLALEIVSGSAQTGADRPMPTEYYIYWAGKYSDDPAFKDLNLSFTIVRQIPRMAWQLAKSIVYGDKFNFKPVL